MKITSYGASQGVTGSCHLLEVNGKQVLLDCGIFQGGKSARAMNEEGFPFDPSKLDKLIVSHAHLDHIGRVPLLHKLGFRGEVISTRPSYELARISMLDSASIMESNARRLNKRRDKDEPKIEPLYDDEDVLNVLECWTRFEPYAKKVNIVDGIDVTFRDAGHIIGSAFLEFDLEEGGEKRKFIFSGDIGNINKPIIRDPQTPCDADFVMMESTYGNRDHRPFSDSISQLEEAARETMAGGGNLIIPTFALERAQELLYVLYEAWKGGRIPNDTKIFLDSPMAINATRVFENHPECYDAEALKLRASGGDPFSFPALNYTRESKDSIAINDVKSGAIILAGSGMVTGGRVLHHLKQNLGRENCAVAFIGYQAYGTTGRRIVEGAETVRIHRSEIPCAASVYTINGFSGHGGRRELTDWVQAAGAKHIMLVHGDPEVKTQFKGYLENQTSAKSVQVMPHAESIDLLALEK